jgi:hypothetical protein
MGVATRYLLKKYKTHEDTYIPSSETFKFNTKSKSLDHECYDATP